MSKRTPTAGGEKLSDGGFDPPPSFAAERIAGLACTTRRPGPGQPLWLLVHGWMCERRFWSPFLARLPAGHGAIACDLPGHGDTPPCEDPDAWTLDVLARRVEALARSYAGRELILVGHSMGGFIAQKVAAALGAELSRLVLVTTAGGAVGGMISVRLALAAPGPRMGAAFDELFPGWFGRRADGAVIEHVRRVMLAQSWPLGRALALDYAEFDGTDLHPGIGARTLVLSGGADGSATTAQSVRLAAAIAGAEVAVMEASGHFPMLEEPDAFAALMLDWEARTGAGRS